MGVNSKSPPEFAQRQPPPQGMAGLGYAAGRLMGRGQPQSGQPESPQPSTPLPSQRETPQGIAGMGAAMAMALRKLQGRGSV